MFTDISERKQLEGDRAHLYEEMKRALRIREELLGFASHDLRNPLQIMLLSLQLLNKITRDVPGAEKLIGRIRSAADRMDRLIRDFLDLEKIEGGSLHWISKRSSFNRLFMML